MTGPRPGAGSSLSDGELLRDSSRDSRAFALFYSRHVDAVLAWCYQRTGDAETAADLAMEVFAEAFVTRRRYRADTSTARPWLLGIARNQLGRLARGRRLSTRYRERLGIATMPNLETADFERIEALVDLEPMRRAVRDAMESVPTHEADALWLRVGLNLPYDQVADRLGCSAGAARVRVVRGLRRLSEGLGLEAL